MKRRLPFRQIHLDFHTSEAIDSIGVGFDKTKFQNTLLDAHVDSVTLFATCHHGWSYYNSEVGERHPNLDFDLLRAQYEACREVGINTPIYLTAGIHNRAAELHPEWLLVDPEGKAHSNILPGFKMLSFHSPYLDHLCEQIEEVVSLFPEADGIFLDIISQADDCSVWALKHMQSKGLDPKSKEDRLQSRLDALHRYYERATESAQKLVPDMPVFHNSGNIPRGYRKIFKYFSHYELESLPTGGWGYDHFPISAKYTHQLGHEYSGMTGKFHTTWGEFGGYKHPNALRYECCAMLAFGARCSVGDQLHPNALLDSSTYAIIGEAYQDVARKEAYVMGARNVADIAVLSSIAVQSEDAFRKSRRESDSDTGAVRVLLEAHFLFDVIDAEMDFDPYKLLVLPDDICVSVELEAKLRDYLSRGGKLLLSGESGIDPERGMIFDVGGQIGEPSEYNPDYLLPAEALRPGFVNSPMVMYDASRRIQVMDGASLGDVYDPYFNRDWDHFCSHQHTPPRPEPSGYACGVRKGNVAYLAHPLFTIYRNYGQVALRQYISAVIEDLLSEPTVVLRGLPSTGRVSLMHQEAESRYVLHLLHANTISRGGASHLSGGTHSANQCSYEVIEDLIPIHDIEVELVTREGLQAVRLEPSGETLGFEVKNGRVSFMVEKLSCHQMVVLDYA
ncbi:alpha-amylase family protein [Coraliomargarita parva]|uniref:alpha-amylase family protein n=1 Tax=Coraliomargarita parva TaxID=3014050 RepID=UPI0022B58149|nr:beta-galactosidase trimerization domain-containing protein [Coraliomargarita parva]